MNGGYRFPSRRQLVNDRNIQIAIQRHRQCTRNRCGGHHQHVRRLYIFRPEAGTLCHSEAVLFVNNDQSQRREVHRIFNDRVRTYQDFHISRQQSGQDRFPLLSFDRSGQQFDTDIHTEKQFLDCLVMLVRQNFGGSHHARLKTVVQCKQHAHQCYQGFTTTHVSLKQTVHLPAASHIIPYFFQYPFLCTRQLKRKVLRIESIENIPYPFKDISTISSLAVFRIAEDIQLHVEQFFEFKTILSPAQRIGIRREMDIPECLRQRHQMMVRQDFGRKRFRQGFLYLLDHRSHHLLNRMRIEKTPFHFLRRIIIRLQSDGRKFQIIRLIDVGMCHIDTPVKHGRLTEDDVFFVKFILT